MAQGLFFQNPRTTKPQAMTQGPSPYQQEGDPNGYQDPQDPGLTPLRQPDANPPVQDPNQNPTDWQPGVGELGGPVGPDGQPIGDAHLGDAFGGGPVGPPTPEGGTPTTPVTPAAPTPASMAASKLSDLINRGITPSENDPEIQKSLQANRLAGQRSTERGRALAAELARKQGFGDSGGFESQLFGLEANRGANEQKFEGDLFNQNSQDRIASILQALALQNQITQGNNNTGFNYAQLQAMLNSDAFKNLLGGAQGGAA